MNSFISDVRSFQQSFFSCCHFWNKEVSGSLSSGTAASVFDFKDNIRDDIRHALSLPVSTLEQEAELLIAVGQASLLVEVVCVQTLLDRICSVLDSLPCCALKARLLTVLYALCGDEDDLTEVLRMLMEWEKRGMSREEREAADFFEEMKKEEII